MLAASEKVERGTHFTYADYLAWDEDVRAEIIRGVVYMMSAPLTVHQRIVGRLYFLFASFLQGKPCEAFVAPFGVRLFPKDDHSDDTVVEPDISVICDPSKIDERGCNGPPDLIIEVLSPSNFRKERLLKFNLYLNAGVREYWVVWPEEREVDVHVLDNGRYVTMTYGLHSPDSTVEGDSAEIVPVSVLPGFEVKLREVFRW